MSSRTPSERKKQEVLEKYQTNAYELYTAVDQNRAPRMTGLGNMQQFLRDTMRSDFSIEYIRQKLKKAGYKPEKNIGWTIYPAKLCKVMGVR